MVVVDRNGSPSVTVDDPPIVDAGPRGRAIGDFGWHTRPVRVAAAVIVVAIVASVWGYTNPGNYLYVQRLLNHPVLAAFVVVFGVIVAIGWLIRQWWIRWPLVVSRSWSPSSV